jgi:L-ascorbate metabolism protein UlaG (beta-lactamase superfamily)
MTVDGPPARITWLGHSTALIEVDGVRLLTDPLLRRRVAHLRRAGRAPVLAGPLDGVLLSHVHRDHLDLPSLRRLPRDARLVVPRGARRIVRRCGFRRVVEADVGDVVDFGPVRVEVTPAAHGEVRRHVRMVSPALGFVARGTRSVYFAGDTDVFAEMAAITNLDVALLPVAGWGPRPPPGHLDPARAADALALLRPRICVPIHWGTFRTPFGPPPDDVAPLTLAVAAARTAPAVLVQVLRPGDTLVI